MDTVEIGGEVYRGTHCGSVGVYTHVNGSTYAGGHKGGKAHGEGVVTLSDGSTDSAQFADGDLHGHREDHWADGDVVYRLCERGELVHFARVRPDGNCAYDNKPCGADHAGLAALKAAAQKAGVHAPYPHPTQCPRGRPNPRRTRRSVFALRSILVPRVGPRRWACVRKCARVYECVRPCVRVPARVCVCG
jgi:hypothetical protein